MASKINWDILSLTRFLLAFVVVIEHLNGFVNDNALQIFSFLGAFEAIFGFLLISGLSIGKSISRDKEFYFKRRLKRIYPVYLVSVLFTILVMQEQFNLHNIGFIIINLLFLNHVFSSTSLVGPAWTLAVEVWLYALAPLFLKCTLRQLFVIIYLSFFCYCIYTCGRTLFDFKYYSGTSYGMNLILLAFVWVSGFAVAIFPMNKKLLAWHVAFIFIAHMGLTILIQSAYRYKHHELNLLLHQDLITFVGRSICLSIVYLIVLFNSSMPIFTGLTKRVCTLLGNISYPLYLVHSSVFTLVSRWGVTNEFLMVAAALLFSFFVYFVFDTYSKKRDALATSILNPA